MSKKSALEQALLESDEILKVVEKNAKDMLFAQMKPDLEKTIRESFEAEDEDAIEDNIDDTTSMDSETEAGADEFGSEEAGDDLAIDSGEETGAEEVADETPAVEVGDDETEISGDEFGSEDELDLTGASDEDVIKVFKKLSDDAEIEIVKDGDTLSINANGEEYIVKLGDEAGEEAEVAEIPVVAEGAEAHAFIDELEMTSSDEDEIIYEIVMDDEESEVAEPTLDEVARTHADGRKQERKPEGFFKYAETRVRPAVNENTANEKQMIKEAEELKTVNAGLINENTSLKEDLNKHKEALRTLKENLEKVALFNTNLANVNRIFCEHATTIDEKKSIIERFDTVETIKESKSLFKVIAAELKNKTQAIAESVESKITKTVSGTGAPLLESVQPQSAEVAGLDRIKKLIAYTNKESGSKR